MRVTRRHLTGYLKGLPGASRIRQRLLTVDELATCLSILAEEEARVAAGPQGWTDGHDDGPAPAELAAATA